jgi:hypothetical protein
LQQTPNYALKKIDLADSPPDITVMNPNWDKIDQVLKDIQDAINSGATDEELSLLRQDLAAHLAEKASLTKAGHVQLNNATNSTDETTAATPKAVKTAYDRADAAFTSASNGKVLVRDAITGKGGTVADADGDGFPTYQELADGVNTVSSESKATGGTFLQNKIVTGTDKDDNLYTIDYGNRVGRKYSPQGTELWYKGVTSPNNVFGVSQDGYVRSGNGVEIRDFNDTLLARVTNIPVAKYRALYRKDGHLLASQDSSSTTMSVYSLAGNKLLDVGYSGLGTEYPAFVNKRNTFIVPNGSSAVNTIYAVDTSLNKQEYYWLAQAMWGIDWTTI